MEPEFDPFHELLTNRIEQAFWWALTLGAGYLAYTRQSPFFVAAGVAGFAMCWVSWVAGKGRKRGLLALQARYRRWHGVRTSDRCDHTSQAAHHDGERCDV